MLPSLIPHTPVKKSYVQQMNEAKFNNLCRKLAELYAEQEQEVLTDCDPADENHDVWEGIEKLFGAIPDIEYPQRSE